MMGRGLSSGSEWDSPMGPRERGVLIGGVLIGIRSHVSRRGLPQNVRRHGWNRDS